MRWPELGEAIDDDQRPEALRVQRGASDGSETGVEARHENAVASVGCFQYRGEVAGRWRYVDGQGEFGIISSVTVPFCRDCTRARVSADGQVYTCLYAATGHDLRAVLRDGSDDAALAAFITDLWRGRDDRYSELRANATRDGRPELPRIEMFAMGG